MRKSPGPAGGQDAVVVGQVARDPVLTVDEVPGPH
jgi:hypothetical protein